MDNAGYGGADESHFQVHAPGPCSGRPPCCSAGKAPVEPTGVSLNLDQRTPGQLTRSHCKCDSSTCAYQAQVDACHERWTQFSIWGAGRDGKAFFKALSPEGKSKVIGFWDVDANKIGKVYVDPDSKRHIPIRSRY